MFEFYENNFDRLEEDLKILELERDDLLQRAEQAIEMCEQAISEIKNHFKEHGFDQETDEINFFKSIKPRFVARLIYYLNVFNIESNRPNGSVKIKRRYLQIELNKLKYYFDDNLDFYRYFRTGSTYLDHKYFVRGNHDIRLQLDSHFIEADPGFSTSHDFKISNILANDLLQVYLENELNKLDFQGGTKDSGLIPKGTLHWTGSKVALIELLYAFYTSGTFNNGNADIKTIARYLEKVFDIELGDYYRTYLEIRMRHNPTKFLDSLKTSLLNKMDEDDAR